MTQIMDFFDSLYNAPEIRGIVSVCQKPVKKLEAAGLAPLDRGGMAKAAKAAFARGERYRIGFLSLSHGLRRDSSLVRGSRGASLTLGRLRQGLRPSVSSVYICDTT